MNAPRYIEIRDGEVYSNVEVLEVFRYGGEAREFSLRLRRGLAPRDDLLIAAVCDAYNIGANPGERMGMKSTLSPMAGDRVLVIEMPNEPSAVGFETDGQGITPRAKSSIADIPFVLKPEDQPDYKRPPRKGK